MDGVFSSVGRQSEYSIRIYCKNTRREITLVDDLLQLIENIPNVLLLEYSGGVASNSRQSRRYLEHGEQSRANVALLELVKHFVHTEQQMQIQQNDEKWNNDSWTVFELKIAFIMTKSRANATECGNFIGQLQNLHFHGYCELWRLKSMNESKRNLWLRCLPFEIFSQTGQAIVLTPLIYFIFFASPLVNGYGDSYSFLTFIPHNISWKWYIIAIEKSFE